jgi:hypothetical protein
MNKRNVEIEDEVPERSRQLQQQQEEMQSPARKIIKKLLGKIRKYNYVTTVKSMEELEKFRFKVIIKK